MRHKQPASDCVRVDVVAAQRVRLSQPRSPPVTCLFWLFLSLLTDLPCRRLCRAPELIDSFLGSKDSVWVACTQGFLFPSSALLQRKGDVSTSYQFFVSILDLRVLSGERRFGAWLALHLHRRYLPLEREPGMVRESFHVILPCKVNRRAPPFVNFHSESHCPVQHRAFSFTVSYVCSKCSRSSRPCDVV